MTKKTKVFISRKLVKDSDFRTLLQGSKIDITDEYLIDFQPIAFKRPHTKWLFFYSKFAIRYYLGNGGDHLPFLIAVFGPSSALYFQSITNRQADFVGSAKKNDVAQNFMKQEHYESCTFIVGKNSLRSVQKLLSSNNHSEIIVYINQEKHDFQIDFPDIAIFTSPLSVKVYFNKYNHRDHHNIAIGKTTALALKNCGRTVDDIALEPNEKGLAASVTNWMQKTNLIN